MSTLSLATIRLLIKKIGILSNSLSDAVPEGSKDNKIWSVMNTDECDTPHETFNQRFNALFAEDCRDSDGCLHYVCQKKLGMSLVVPYLLKTNWTGFLFDLVDLKLRRLLTELKHLQYALSILIIIRRPQSTRTLNLTTKLKDSANASTPELSFQRKAVEDFHSRQAQQPTENHHHDSPALSTPDSRMHSPPSTNTAPIPQNKHNISSITDDDSFNAGDNQPRRRTSPSKSECCFLIHSTTIAAKNRSTTASSSQSSMINNLDFENTDNNILAKGMVFPIFITCTDDIFTGKNKHATLGNPVATDEDGLLMDVDIQSIEDNPVTHEDKRQDVDHFFHNAVVKDVNRKSKKYRACKLYP